MKHKKSEYVILLHGLALSSFFMRSIEKDLLRAGYHVVNVDYPSTSYPISQLSTTYISKALEECSPASKIHFVTHSMGGILVRYYLKYNTIDTLGHVVMLGPPNKGSEIVDTLQNFFLFKWIFGDTGRELTTDMHSTPNSLGDVNFSLGVIAGTRYFEPIGALLLPSPHDGKVSVESTKVAGMKEHKVLSVTHTFMVTNKKVQKYIRNFLKNGSFDK